MEIAPADPAAQLALEVAELKRRLSALETARNVAAATVHGGRLIVADGDENVAQFGRFDVTDYDSGEPVERFGVEIVDPDTGLVVLRSTVEDGTTAPKREVSWSPYSSLFQSTTSGSFVPVWITRSTLWPSSGAFLGTNITITGTASWEARIKIGSLSTGNFYTDVIAGSGSQTVVWRVDLLANGYVLNDALGLRFDLELRRTSGTGTVYAELPYPALAWDATTEEASPGGL